MDKLEFSLPFNDDTDTLTELFNLQGTGGSDISEIYLSCPQEFSGSGRITPRMRPEKFTDIVKLIQNNGIKTNIVINSTCQGADWYSGKQTKNLLDFLERMYHEHGITSITVANPIFMRLIKKYLPQMEVCASVLSDIDSVQKAVIAREYGADTITPDANINRDLHLLTDIKSATGAKIKIMVNEGCLLRCIFRKYHFNFVSHFSKELEHSRIDGKDFFAHCTDITLRDHSQVFKSGWIRPEDLSRYKAITTSFKIVGRARPKTHVLRTVKAYMQKAYHGNLFDIICSSLNAFGLMYGAYVDNMALDRTGFTDTVYNCRKQCTACDYCTSIASQLLKLNVVSREKLEDMGRSEVAFKLESAGKLPYFG